MPIYTVHMIEDGGDTPADGGIKGAFTNLHEAVDLVTEIGPVGIDKDYDSDWDTDEYLERVEIREWNGIVFRTLYTRKKGSEWPPRKYKNELKKRQKEEEACPTLALMRTQ